jgi:hypothetical protein
LSLYEPIWLYKACLDGYLKGFQPVSASLTLDLMCETLRSKLTHGGYRLKPLQIAV